MTKAVSTKAPIRYKLHQEDGLLVIKIEKDNLTATNLQSIGSIIDSYFEKNGPLDGIVVNAKKFPRWTDANNKRDYMDFVSSYHQKTDKVAISIGGFFIKILVRLAKGRVHPEVKAFSYKKLSQAKQWVINS